MIPAAASGEGSASRRACSPFSQRAWMLATLPTLEVQTIQTIKEVQTADKLLRPSQGTAHAVPNHTSFQGEHHVYPSLY